MSAPPGFNPAQSLLPDVAAPITPAMGGGGMVGGGPITDFLKKLLPEIKTRIPKIRYMNKGKDAYPIDYPMPDYKKPAEKKAKNNAEANEMRALLEH